MAMPLNRRQFASQAVLGAVATGVASQAVAQPAKDAAPKNVFRDIAEAQFATLEQLYPDNLTDEHRAALKQRLERQAIRSRMLSSFKLTNADEPATMFAAYRAEG
jgi:hypothetical protein